MLLFSILSPRFYLKVQIKSRSIISLKVFSSPYIYKIKITNLSFFPFSTPSCTPIISICIHVPYVSLDTFISPSLPIYIFILVQPIYKTIFPRKIFLQFFSQSIRIYELLVRREMSNTSKKRERIINSRRGVKKKEGGGRTRSYVSFSPLI